MERVACSPRSAGVTPLQRYYGTVHPWREHRYFQSWGGCPLALFRLTSHAKFSRSPPKPELSSCRLYTGCRLASSQITSKLFPQDNGARGFDSVTKVFRCLIDGSLALIFSTRT